MRVTLKALWLGAALCAGLATSPVLSQTTATVPPVNLLPPDWVQSGTRGIDAAVSEDGQRWYVGTDGRAYRRDEAAARWVPYGTRSDLARIDAAREGAAAITRSGELLVTGNAATGEWRPTGMRALDVGIGKGRIWLADALMPDNSRAVLHAAFDATGTMTWSNVSGRVQRIDVDGEGRPWGLDAEGRLFVHANERWIADATAPAAADVGVSANGTVLVVSRQIDAGLGGGTLHARHPQTGAWSAVPGRATAISAEPDGRAFGVNSLNWVIGGTRPTITVAAAPEPTPAKPTPAAGEVRLADLAPAGLALPESLADVLVRVRSGNPSGSLAATGTALIGDAFLNGVATRVIRYAPVANGPVNLLLTHRTLRVGDYMPDLATTGVRNFPFGDVIISFVPAVNAEKKARAADATLIAKEPGLTDFASFAPPAGTTLTGTLDFASIPNGTAVSSLMGLGTSKVVLTARNVDAALFKEVRDSRAAVTAAAPARTLKELADKYGAKLIEGLAFEAPVKALDGKQFGPAKLTSPSWLFALAQGEDTFALSVGLAATMGMNIQAPAPDSMAQAAANRTPTTSAIRSTPETLELSNVRVMFDPPKRSATLDGNITRAASSRVASLKDFSLDSARFSGSLALADGQNSITSLTSLKTLELALNGAGRLPSQASTSGTKVDFEVKLALNDERNAVVPSITATASLTLADVVGSSVPGADRVKLTRVEWTPGTVAGNASLYGLPVRAVRHQGAGMAAPIVGLYHRELDLGSYIPAIRGTNIGSFGLANAVLYVLPEAAQPVTYKTADEMPAVLAALLDRKGLDDIDPFPLTLRPGVNVIGLWGAKGEKETDGGVAAKVKAIYGLEDKAFIAKGNFKVSALGNAKLESGPSETGSGQGGTGGTQGGSTGGSRGGSPSPGNPQSGSQGGSSGSGSQSGSQSTSQGSSGTSGPRGNRTVSVSQVACAADTTLNVANRASGGNLDTAGLDLSFGLPGFNPPYAAGRVRFSNVSFALKDVDGQLEPAIVGSMAINVARTVGDLNALARHTGAPPTMQTGGVNQIGLAAKLRVRGDLNTLCNGVKPDSSYEIAFAGSTALNIADVGKHAFEALEKVTNLDPPEEPAEGSATPPATPSDPLAAKVLELARKIADDMRRAALPQKGWTPAFGLPFLEIRKFAVAGTFGQKDGKRTLTGTIWTDSKLGTETVDVLGSLSLEAESENNEFKIADWLLRAPGPVKLTGLPGVAKLMNAPTLSFINLDDMTVRSLELTPGQMQGRLASSSRNLQGRVVLLRSTAPNAASDDFELFAGVNRLSPNMLLKGPPGVTQRQPATQAKDAPSAAGRTAQLAGAAGAITLGKTMFALRSGAASASKSIQIKDLPAPVKRIMADTFDDRLVTDDTEIPWIRGLSIAGRVTPGDINRPELDSLKALFETLELTAPMPVFGGVESSTGSTATTGFVDVLIPSLLVPGLPQGQLRLSNSRIALASLSDGRRMRVNTNVSFAPPAEWASTLGKELQLAGTLDYLRETTGSNAGDTTVTIAASSNIAWNSPVSIPGVTFGNIGVEAQATRRSGVRARNIALTADASVSGVAATARLGLSSDGSGQAGALLELKAKSGTFNLGSLLPTNLLPADYSVINVASYLILRAGGMMIAKEAGSGRVSFAAEDVVGNINGQTFKGQIAIAGITGPQPVLFISNDERWTPARIFPAAIPKGPFANLPLPDGLVILSPVNGDANISALHPAIYDKVFAKLFGARDAARVLVNNGLTVASRLNLAQDAPPVLGQFAGWLPGTGDMVVGGGIDSTSGGLAFYADIPGLKLPIPTPFNTFISSTDGQVQLYFKTAGAAGAGAEVGVSGNVSLGIPRLDSPSTIQRVAASLSLSSTTAAGQSPTLAVGVRVPGTWASPAGLDGFSLTDTDVSFGVGGTGTTVSIATQRAQFQSGGESKAFALDLNTAWLGGAPTQLSVQFAKSPDTPELIVTPALQAELANSVLQLALKGGSALNAAISSALGTSGIDAPARAAFDGVATLMSNSANGATGLMRRSPLSMIGVKNPVVYFVTPGNSLPPRPGIEQPPFGLGLLVQGQLILDIGTQQVDLANGVYKINLRDGFFVSGRLTPPSPFSATTFEVSGTQPLISPTPNALRVSGRLALPGMNLVPGVDASLSGSFEFNKPLALNVGADVKGSVSIGGLANRDAYFTVRSGSIEVYSAPGGCIDVPVKLEGNVSAANLTNPASLLTVASPAVPNVADCLPMSLGDLARVGEIGANFVKDVALDLVTENPVENVKKAYELGKQGVELAANTAQAAGTLALNLASVVVNPSQAYQSAKAAFDGAVKLASQAADALANLGCKLVSWMPGNHPCRKRERQKRADKEAADRAAFEAAVALSEEQRKLEAQIQNTMVTAELQRSRAEQARAALRGKQREAVNNVLRSAGSIKSASWCGEGQFFSASLGRCWDATNLADGPLGLLAHTGDGSASCLARRRDNFVPPSLRGNCEIRDGYKFVRYYTDIKWRFMPNGQIRAEEMEAPRFGSGPARWVCLTIQRNSEWISAQQSYRFTENLAAPVVAGYCDDNSPSWRYTPKGELMSPSGYCLVPAKTAVTVPRSASAMETTYAAGTLFLKPCNDAAIAVPPGRLRWTPIVPTDAGQLAGLPATAKLRAGTATSAFCIGGSGGYLDRFTLERCNAAGDLGQYFAFGVEGAAGGYVTTMAARNNDLCIGAGGNPEDPNEILGTPCYGSAAQKFDVIGDAKAGAVQFRNRGTNKCLAIDGDVAEGAELGFADCSAGDSAQRFSVQATSTQGKTFTRKAIPTEALRDAWALEDLRTSVLYRNVVVEPFNRAGQGVRAGGLNGNLAQTGAAQQWFVLPGRTGGNNYVSLSTAALSLQDWADFSDRKKLLMANVVPPLNSRSSSMARSLLGAVQGVDGQLVIADNKVGNAIFDLNATFEVVAGLNGVPGTVSFRSIADATRYVRLLPNGNFFVEAGTDAAFNNSATFRLKTQ